MGLPCAATDPKRRGRIDVSKEIHYRRYELLELYDRLVSGTIRVPMDVQMRLESALNWGPILELRRRTNAREGTYDTRRMVTKMLERYRLMTSNPSRKKVTFQCDSPTTSSSSSETPTSSSLPSGDETTEETTSSEIGSSTPSFDDESPLQTTEEIHYRRYELLELYDRLVSGTIRVPMDVQMRLKSALNWGPILKLRRRTNASESAYDRLMASRPNQNKVSFLSDLPTTSSSSSSSSSDSPTPSSLPSGDPTTEELQTTSSEIRTSTPSFDDESPLQTTEEEPRSGRETPNSVYFTPTRKFEPNEDDGSPECSFSTPMREHDDAAYSGIRPSVIDMCSELKDIDFELMDTTELDEMSDDVERMSSLVKEIMAKLNRTSAEPATSRPEGVVEEQEALEMTSSSQPEDVEGQTSERTTSSRPEDVVEGQKAKKKTKKKKKKASRNLERVVLSEVERLKVQQESELKPEDVEGQTSERTTSSRPEDVVEEQEALEMTSSSQPEDVEGQTSERTTSSRPEDVVEGQKAKKKTKKKKKKASRNLERVVLSEVERLKVQQESELKPEDVEGQTSERTTSSRPEDVVEEQEALEMTSSSQPEDVEGQTSERTTSSRPEDVVEGQKAKKKTKKKKKKASRNLERVVLSEVERLKVQQESELKPEDVEGQTSERTTSSRPEDVVEGQKAKKKTKQMKKKASRNLERVVLSEVERLKVQQESELKRIAFYEQVRSVVHGGCDMRDAVAKKLAIEETCQPTGPTTPAFAPTPRMGSSKPPVGVVVPRLMMMPLGRPPLLPLPFFCGPPPLMSMPPMMPMPPMPPFAYMPRPTVPFQPVTHLQLRSDVVDDGGYDDDVVVPRPTTSRHGGVQTDKGKEFFEAVRSQLIAQPDAVVGVAEKKDVDENDVALKKEPPKSTLKVDVAHRSYYECIQVVDGKLMTVDGDSTSSRNE